MVITTFKQKDIIIPIQFDERDAVEIAKKFKFQRDDYDLLMKRLNMCFRMYATDRVLLNNKKRQSELVKYTKEFLCCVEELIALLKGRDYYLDHFLHGNIPPGKAFSLELLEEQLLFFLANAKQYLPTQRKDKGEVKEKDGAFKCLIKNLLGEFIMFSPKNTIPIFWDRVEGKYKGLALPFIRHCLRMSKIKPVTTDLGQYVRRIYLLQKRKPACQSTK